MASKPNGGNSPLTMDLTKVFPWMKLPFVPDIEALVAAQWRNIEALTAANNVTLTGAHAVARRNIEIMQQTMADLFASVQSLAIPEAPQVKATKQADVVKMAYLSVTANMEELAEMVRHVGGEAMEVLNKRFMEAMDEVKASASQAQ